jgi:hypothetical protein
MTLPQNRNLVRALYAASAVLALTAIPLSGQAHASGQTRMPIVGNYGQAKGKEMFQAESRFGVPESLIQKIDIETPNRAFTEGYPEVFLQNERMVVCNVDCDREQNLRPILDVDGRFTVQLKSDTENRRKNRALDDSVLRQTTVYHWVNKVLQRFEEMGHQYQHRLLVRVDREVTDPSSGTKLDNNAFFIDADLDSVNWSLNFLPPKNSLLVKVMVGEVVASAFDPSVAMHEATHFLFQEMIGEILNPEIYGLHEAFADYFAMSTIGDSEIGRIMFKGKALRSASKILEYSTGMEAHDLGNVVLSGLWNIRDLFSNKDLADRVAFATIRDLSRNPYTSAGDVVDSYARALAEVSPSVAADSEFRAKVDSIWAQTKLKSSNPGQDMTGVIQAPFTQEEKSSLVTIAMTQELAAEVVKEWGMKQRETVVLTQGPVRPVPLTGREVTELQAEAQKRKEELKAKGETPSEDASKAPDHIYEWRFVAIQDLDGENSERRGQAEAVPFWILKDTRSNTMLGAYDLAGRKVMPESNQAYSRLLKVTENLAGLQDYAENFGSDIAVLLEKKAWSQIKARRIRASRDHHFSVGFSGQFAEMTEYEIRPRITFLGWLMGLLGDGTAKNFKSISLFGVNPADVPTLAESGKLPKLPDGNILVGYKYELKSGLRMSGRLISIGE